MNEHLILDPAFKTMGLIVIASSLLVMFMTATHAIYYHRQQNLIHKDQNFLKDLALRLKVLFIVICMISILDLIAGVSLQQVQTQYFWYIISAMMVGAKLSLGLVAIWLWMLYDREAGND